MSIKVTDAKFQELIKTCYQAQKSYNQQGKEAGIYVLNCLKSAADTLIQHIQNDSNEKEYQKLYNAVIEMLDRNGCDVFLQKDANNQYHASLLQKESANAKTEKGEGN